MVQRMNVLEGERAQAVIAGFGGARPYKQLAAAHARFGKAFGFTVAVVEPVGGPTDGRPQWLTAREALRTLVQKIETYADPEIDGSEALAAFLLAPYVELVTDLEKSRRSRPKKPDDAPAPPSRPRRRPDPIVRTLRLHPRDGAHPSRRWTRVHPETVGGRVAGGGGPWLNGANPTPTIAAPVAARHKTSRQTAGRPPARGTPPGPRRWPFPWSLVVSQPVAPIVKSDAVLHRELAAAKSQRIATEARCAARHASWNDLRRSAARGPRDRKNDEIPRFAGASRDLCAEPLRVRAGTRGRLHHASSPHIQAPCRVSRARLGRARRPARAARRRRRERGTGARRRGADAVLRRRARRRQGLSVHACAARRSPRARSHPRCHPLHASAAARREARAEKRWTLGKRGYVSLVLEMLNVTLAKDPEGIVCYMVVDSLNCKVNRTGPVTMPSIGVEGGI